MGDPPPRAHMHPFSRRQIRQGDVAGAGEASAVGGHGLDYPGGEPMGRAGSLSSWGLLASVKRGAHARELGP